MMMMMMMKVDKPW